jgi:hypothetical protein
VGEWLVMLSTFIALIATESIITAGFVALVPEPQRFELHTVATAIRPLSRQAITLRRFERQMVAITRRYQKILISNVRTALYQGLDVQPSSHDGTGCWIFKGPPALQGWVSLASERTGRYVATPSGFERSEPGFSNDMV